MVAHIDSISSRFAERVVAHLACRVCEVPEWFGLELERSLELGGWSWRFLQNPGTAAGDRRYGKFPWRCQDFAIVLCIVCSGFGVKRSF